MKTPSLWSLLRKVHNDEKGAVSLETILVVALIALPILIFLYNYGWPRIREYFTEGLDELEEGRDEFSDPGTLTY
jgi:Flp pilus assembly pilin Flp